MNLKQATQHCHQGHALTDESIPPLVGELLDERVPSSEKADFLRALAQKGETAGELAGFTRAILPHAVSTGVEGRWNDKPILDCCGTGGGKLNIVNISTGMIFILSAAGVPVVKHGNRGMTKRSGSADVLEAMGIRAELKPEEIPQALEELNWAFAFAPAFHPAFKAVALVRKELAAEGQRTIFNLLGPLLNPVRPQAQLMGVFREEHLQLFSGALGQLGCQRYWIAFGKNAKGEPVGEVSADGKTKFDGKFSDEAQKGTLPPSADESFNFNELLVNSREESAAKIIAVLKGEGSVAVHQMLIVNSAAGLVVQGAAKTMEEGVALAEEQIASGRALRRLKAAQELFPLN